MGLVLRKTNPNTRRMTMPIGYDIFNNVRINSVMQGIMDPRLLPGEFVFSRRVPTVRAVDSEVTARFIQYPQIADLIAEDQRAVVYQTGKFQLSTTRVPKLKIGANVTETMLTQILQIGNSGGAVSSMFTDWESATLFNLKLGLAQRVEVLLAAMMTDSFVYDRLGLKVSASWGMPSDLKVTPAVSWDTAATATPIDDILNLRRLAQVKYGVRLNRLTMSLAAFNYMIATTQFQNRAKAFLPTSLVLGTNYPTQNTNDMQALATRILDGIGIELYDQMYWSQDEAGTATMAPYLPITKVVFDSTTNDNNGRVWDLANTEVQEAKVAALGGQPIGPANAVGPLSYATFPPNLNPPNITYWAVQRCFPRKHVLQANAVLTVGAFSDPIGATVPF